MDIVSAYIDGFNVYHSLANNRYKWLNYRKLIEFFVRKDDVIKDIYYFTSLAYWQKDKADRHRLYIRALESLGIKTVYGTFKADNKVCDYCGHRRCTHTEKKTDVNIALTIYEHASLDFYDRAILLTGDSDQVPTIKVLRKNFKSKEFIVLTPPGNHTKELIQASEFHYKITEASLSASRLPDEVVLKNKKVIYCPDEWR